MQTMHNYLHDFDKAVLSLIKHLPSWLRPVMQTATFVGEPIMVLALGVIIGLYGLFKGAHRMVLAVVIGFAAFGVNTVIKNIVHRTRPDTLFAHNMRIKSYSFPSGHAFGSMFFFGLLAYFAYTRLAYPWNILIAVALGLLIFLVGTSRIYLGAHFPSDVLVGWLFGGLCLFLVIRFVHP